MYRHEQNIISFDFLPSNAVLKIKFIRNTKVCMGKRMRLSKTQAKQSKTEFPELPAAPRDLFPQFKILYNARKRKALSFSGIPQAA